MKTLLDRVLNRINLAATRAALVGLDREANEALVNGHITHDEYMKTYRLTIERLTILDGQAERRKA